MSYFDYYEGEDDESHDYDYEYDFDDRKFECCFPGRCMMPGYHLSSECHTAQMYKDYVVFEAVDENERLRTWVDLNVEK